MKPRIVHSISAALLSVAALAPAAPQGPSGGGEGSAAPGQEQGQGRGQRPRVEERVTVTAARIPEALEEVGSSVTVITAEEIAASGARWLGEVLEWAPGVTVVRSGPPGTVTSVFLRGTNSNHALVLVNGIKVNSPSTGAYDLAHLPAALIRRIEIVRGPQSSLYGSEALGGVIHVITEEGHSPGAVAVEADGGSFGTGRLVARVAGQLRRLRYAAGLSYYNSSGFSAAAADRGNVEADGYRNLSAEARVGYRFAAGAELEGFVRALDARTDLDDFVFGVGPADDDNFRSDSRELYASLRVSYRAGPWDATVTVSDSEVELAASNPDGPFLRGFRLDAAIRELDWQNRVALPGRQALIGGIEYRREEARTGSETIFGVSGFDEGVGVVGLYLHDRIAVGDGAVFSIGGRYTKHSAFGGHGTFRATASVHLAPGLRLHGSAGTGFRAPSLNDLFFPFFGNRELAPERSRGLDAGLEATLDGGSLRLDVTWFRQRVEDLIQFSVATFRAENVARATSAGVELTGSWKPRPGFSVAGSYTFTDAIDEELGLGLLRRPRHQGGLRATLRPHGRLRLFTEVRAKGRRPDFGPTGRVSLDAYAVWNAAAELELAPGWALTGRVDNLLDRAYEEVFGFGTAGLSAYVGLRVRRGVGS